MFKIENYNMSKRYQQSKRKIKLNIWGKIIKEEMSQKKKYCTEKNFLPF